MGDRRKKHRRLPDSPTSSSQSESDTESDSQSESESDSDRPSRRRGRSRREKDRRRRKEKEDEERRRRRKKKEKKKKRRDRDMKSRKSNKRLRDSDASESSDEDEERSPRVEPHAVVREIMIEFPNVATDLKQLLQMIDDGQAVDIKGISEESLMKHLKKLFLSLKLKENGDRVFLLPSKAHPTLDVVGPIIHSFMDPMKEQADASAAIPETSSVPVDAGSEQAANEHITGNPDDNSPGPRKRMIGPAMPSAELLAAAAKLTEAQTELNEAELDDDTELFVGPPPPAMVSEAESANEAERFEEVTRIMEVEADSPYDVLGVNHNMSSDNIKKRYWKMSLLVHPDKCSHPQAHQAFIKLNKAFKELQDPEKRKAMDEKIKLKEEQEQFKVELKAMREAALWRRTQGISMEGDDELLAQTEVKVEPKRDEWMTTLPPERKPGGVTMQSTKFSRGTKEGRGDTSIWTDTPSDRAQKAKMNYLEAYNEATALASNEEEKKKASADAELVDKYNKAKRSKTLMQKHQEEVSNKSKKKSKQQKPEKEEWVGQHPWKPWDREKDLTAGRKSVKLDAEGMSQGLSSRCC
ncbi:GPALPP motifs-containing protein [Arachis hypogaea]|uniref:GPALPP motifs-containing protein n=1 Tax=Arachis hypogaea TaxID=3818 RepID=A0A6B9VAZ5_ARAHY|nr:GPALPP motifs-containing protein [Arachis hypogaea]